MIFSKNLLVKLQKPKIRIIYVHARNAILSGISPKGNRMIPPLNYDFVRKIKKKISKDYFHFEWGN